MKLPKKHWTIVRILLFVIVGLINTVLIRPEDTGTWKNYLGYGFLFVALIEIFFLIKQYSKKNNDEK